MEKEEFLKLLPKLIREDDEVKGAIITALSGVVATKDDIKRVIKESNKRFEALMKEMNERFEAVQFQINDKFYKLNRKITIVDHKVDNIGSRGGRGLEKVILEMLKEQNKIKEIDFSKIERVDIVDTEGVIFPKGVTSDIDVLMENGKNILMEIKFKLDSRDLYHFMQVGKLYEKLYKKPDELWAIALEITPETLKNSVKYPIKLIYGMLKE